MERSLLVLLVSIFVAMLGLGIVMPIMPLYAENLGATYTQIGLLTSVWSMARLIFSTPAGRLSDIVSRKKVIMGGLLVYAIVSLLYIVAWDFNTPGMFRALRKSSALISFIRVLQRTVGKRRTSGKYEKINASRIVYFMIVLYS